jgi:uncharacterized protein YbgA (DUF1722 family)/uncharacterized protein YbbK (DUF523 family)
MNDVADRPRIGISACLLGENVRYDGGHKRSRFVTGVLAAHVTFVPVCPEVEAGLPVPREPIRLVGDPRHPRVVGTRSGRDHTERLAAFSAERARALSALRLDGFILKKDSPSCGLARVRVHPEGAAGAGRGRMGPPSREGVGLFAAALSGALPDVPLTEEGWLEDRWLRERFLSSVFTRHRLRLGLADPSAGAVVAQHAAHKLLFMAHSPGGQHRLGRVVAQAGEDAPGAVARRYVRQAMAVLAAVPSRGKHANVLLHILGYFKHRMPAREKQEILLAIDDFRRGVHDLAVPRTLLKHHLGRLPVDWLMKQVYFEPFPRRLGLRT